MLAGRCVSIDFAILERLGVGIRAIYEYIYIYIYVYVYRHMYRCMFMHIYIYIHIYICMYACVYMYGLGYEDHHLRPEAPGSPK